MNCWYRHRPECLNLKENNMSAAPIFIGSDHAGFTLKTVILEYLRAQGRQVSDLGTYSMESCDYPQSAQAVCNEVLAKNGVGILICGTGIGMSIAANRFKGIRAAMCTHEFHAKATRLHNNANVLCLGERVTAPGLALELVKIFLETKFEGGRHERRVEMIEL